MKAIVEKQVEVIRNPKNRTGQTVKYIGMECCITTVRILGIPIYKRVELFRD